MFHRQSSRQMSGRADAPPGDTSIHTHPHQSFTPHPRLSSVCIAAHLGEATAGSARGCDRSRTQQFLIRTKKRNIYIYFYLHYRCFFFSLKNPEGSGWTKCFSSHRGAVIAGLVISGPAAESNETQTHPRGSQQLHAAPAVPRLRGLAFMPQHKNLFTDPLA